MLVVGDIQLSFCEPFEMLTYLISACNLGYIYGNSSYSNFNNVCIDVAATGDQKMSDDCGCCRSSLELSKYVFLSTPSLPLNAKLTGRLAP